jgi:glucoamylase
VQIEQSMAVHPNHDVFMSDIKVTNLRSTAIVCNLIIYSGFDINYQKSGCTCFFDIESSMLTFFSFDRYISMTCDAPVNGFACDKTGIGKLDPVFQDAGAGIFNSREYAVGQVSGAFSHDFGQIQAGETASHRMNMCFARSLEELSKLSSSVDETRPSIEEAIAWWRAQYGDSQLGSGSQVVRNVYDCSLITLRLLTDSGTGGIIAAPECDPDFRSSGGYGLCWPRDGAFIGYTLDSIGQHDHARSFYDWALRVQSEAGVWYQRYYVNGQLAPTWGLVQFDETGAIVWSICRHIRFTGDTAYGHKVFPQLVRACDYMQAKLDPETGLAPLTKDIWEERDGISTYACASTWAGFQELSKLAFRLGKVTEAERWASAATGLKVAIETQLWDASHERFLRGLKTRIHSYEIERLYSKLGFSESDILEIEFAGRPRFFQYRDATVDASILGLSIPFGVFAPDDPRMLATAEAVAKHLASPVGGIRRYQDDAYRGGNPWVICTLWLALQDLASGQKERASKLYNWVLEHRTHLDLLPEQVDRTTGEPCWVVPLGWSHAMFILISHALAEQGLLPQ